METFGEQALAFTQVFTVVMIIENKRRLAFDSFHVLTLVCQEAGYNRSYYRLTDAVITPRKSSLRNHPRALLVCRAHCHNLKGTRIPIPAVLVSQISGRFSVSS